MPFAFLVSIRRPNMAENKQMINYETEDENDSLSIYMKEVNKIPMISHEDEAALAILAKNGDKKARDRLITANLRFVVNVAKQYRGQGLPFEDLVNEGNLGLITALDKFEPNKGYHFISYAVWWIRQSIQKAICEKSKAVRLPLNRANELYRIQKAQKDIAAKTRKEPTLAEIAKETGLDEDLVKDLLMISREMISFDAPVKADGEISDSKVGDMIPDDLSYGPEEAIMMKALKEDIDGVLSTLTESERQVITLRFGLNNEMPMSLQEIGELRGLTKERIRQIEKKALEKIRMPGRVAHLESYVSA